MNEAPQHEWLCGPLPEGVEQVLTRLQRTAGVTHIAVMPDVHLASEFCVGTVVASEEFLFPHAVGGDIGCGMLALEFSADASLLEDADRAARLLGMLQTACPGRRHHRKFAPSLPDELREHRLSTPQLLAGLSSDDARLQLGTLGAGNHFLEFQHDQASGALWLMIHTGSRHFGQLVFHHHLARAIRLGSGILAIPADAQPGRDYLEDVQAARAYAEWNRRLLAQAAARAVEAVLHVAPRMESLVNCDHNHVQRESHVVGGGPRQLFVHRKGAATAGIGEPGLIPGSMATHSFHTLGRGNPQALCSSSHGAGRALSRTAARARISRGDLRRQLRRVFYDARIEGQLLEEAPQAYKDIDAVMRAQAELTCIVRRLTPILVHKGA